jgi:hypothetical protein
MTIGVGAISTLAVGEGFRQLAAAAAGMVILQNGVITVIGRDIAGDVTIIGDTQWVMGSVTLTPGSATVAGIDTRWSIQIDPGNLFVCRHAASPQSMVVYVVSTVGGDESLTLSAPWRGAALTGAPYLIHRRLSARGVPLLGRGDAAVAALCSYAMIILDHLIGA